MEPIIVNVKDKEYRFLSNDSKYGFKLNGERWHTVTHYLEATKFSNEEIRKCIRKAKTVYIARKITRDNKKLIKRRWNARPHLRIALIKKFEREFLREKLRETYNRRIIYRESPLTQEILSEIRMEEVYKGEITDEEQQSVVNFMKLVNRIRYAEGCDKLMDGMIIDAFYTLIPVNRVITEIRYYIHHLNLSNYIQISEIIRMNIGHSDRNISDILAGFIVWLRIKATDKKKKMIFKNLEKAQTIKIQFMKTTRSYRERSPYYPGTRIKKIDKIKDDEIALVKKLIRKHPYKDEDEIRDLLRRKLKRNPVLRRKDINNIQLASSTSKNTSRKK